MTLTDTQHSQANGTVEVVASFDEDMPPALFHRSLQPGNRPYTVTSAKGINLTLADGRVVMDAWAGAAVA